MRLSRDAVLAGAFAILDEYGLADLTMRRLASSLGIQAGGLYWHFENKQTLLTAMSDQILSTVLTDYAPAATWDKSLSLYVRRLREALLIHRDGAELVAAVHALRMGIQDPVAPMIKILESAELDHGGFDQEQSTAAARALLHYVLGHSADEQSHAQLQAVGVTAAGDDHDPLELFEFGLGVFIDGLRARADRLG